jgi:predicted permease
VAQGTLTVAASIIPPNAASAVHFGLRWPMVLFALALTLVTGVAFGLFPAFHSTRASLVTTIRANAGQIAGARSTLRSHTALVIGQIALSTVLLVAAGLFLRSLRNVTSVELGLAADRIATFTISPELNGYSPERSRQLFQRLDAELTALPGVTGVTASRVALFTGGGWSTGVQVEGFKADPGVDNGAMINMIGPDYFRTLGIPLLSGREFTAADREGTSRVAIVNEAFVRKFGLGRDALGRGVAVWGDKELDIQIVGVVGNAKYQRVKDELRASIYTANLQDSKLGTLTYYVRTTRDPARVLGRISAVMSRVDPAIPMQDLKTLPQQIRENVALDRLIGTLAAAFAVLATLLAAMVLAAVALGAAYLPARRASRVDPMRALRAD